MILFLTCFPHNLLILLTFLFAHIKRRIIVICRKPKTGLLDAFLLQNTIDRSKSWVIGDRETDQELANNIGVSFLPVAKDHDWRKIAETILQQKRCAMIKRQTKETTIEISLNLDTDSPSNIHTPIAFFSHMLEQIAKHGGFSLQISATGDVEIVNTIILSKILCIDALLSEENTLAHCQ